MSCLHPTQAWQDTLTVAKNGGHPVVFSWNSIKDHFYPRPDGSGGVELYSERYKPIPIPCGKCVLCRRARAEQIGIRAMFEMKGYPSLQDHAFVTLTVSDDRLHEVFPGSRLQHRPFQLFMKRLRKRGVDVRYLMCGEYGERTHRPHYHAILLVGSLSILILMI